MKPRRRKFGAKFRRMLWWLPPAFFVVSLCYSAAGFGGGSSYLALLALAGLPAGTIRPLALLCNLVVTGGGSFAFWRARVTPWNRAGPLVLASFPAAFLGGRVVLPREQYLLLLGCLLVTAAVFMLAVSTKEVMGERKRWSTVTAILIGMLVGFVSGVVGIGGGIFLSPILFLTRWARAKEIAATTSLFIAVNSVAGLAGQFTRGITVDVTFAAALLVAVLAGGFLGTRLTLRNFSPETIRKIAALLILIVGGRLVYGYWPF